MPSERIEQRKQVGGKEAYETPRVQAYGTILDITRTLPGGNVKGGGPVWHYDRHCEQSEVDLDDCDPFNGVCS